VLVPVPVPVPVPVLLGAVDGLGLGLGAAAGALVFDGAVGFIGGVPVSELSLLLSLDCASTTDAP
jgi:hypothetical protein